MRPRTFNLLIAIHLWGTPLMTKYVTVGCGPAACSAAEAIRQADAGADILLLSFEEVRTLARPRLVEYASGQIPLQELESNKPEWFKERDLAVRLGVRVEHLDVARRELTLAGGEKVPYDKLLIACGIQPRRAPFPGAELDGVAVMNHQSEADAVRKIVERTEHAVAVGGGLLGQDISMALRQAGRGVTMLVREDRVGVPQWDPRGSEILLEELRGLGIDVRLETEVARVEGDGDGRAARVVTTRGDMIDCQLVFAAIGSLPRSDWLKDSSVEVSRGIVVDDRLATAEADVWAAGSCAEIHTCGRVLIQASWGNALAQGKAAGQNMAGDGEPYCKPSDYTTKVGETKFSLFGGAKAAHGPGRFVIFDPPEGPYGALLEERGIVHGGVLAGRHKKAKEIKALQLRDEPVPGLAEMDERNEMSLDAFYEERLGGKG